MGSDSPLLFGTEIVFRAPRWQARVGGKNTFKRCIIDLFVCSNRVPTPDSTSSSESSSDEDETQPGKYPTANGKDSIPLASFVVNVEDEKKDGKDEESAM